MYTIIFLNPYIFKIKIYLSSDDSNLTNVILMVIRKRMFFNNNKNMNKVC